MKPMKVTLVLDNDVEDDADSVSDWLEDVLDEAGVPFSSCYVEEDGGDD